MADFADIRGALVGHYVAGSFGLPTAYENAPFTPPSDGSEWAEVAVLPSQPAVASLGTQGQDRHVGVLQIDLFYPLNSGTQNVTTMADRIRDHFEAGTIATHNGQGVTILSCGRGPGGVDRGWYRLTLTINWRAFTARGA